MITQAVTLWKLADLLITAAQAGLEKQELVDAIKKQEENGMSYAEIAESIKTMRDEAIKKLLD